MYIKVPYILEPRHYQMDFLKAIKENKNVCSVIHRRAGKDTISIQALLLRSLMRVGTHIYLLPLQKQAREVVWSGLDHTGKPFISYIPECLIEYKNDARMEMRLINGSRLIFGGSNNFNGMMGTNPVSIIYSEFSLHNPLARQYLNPILIENGGLEVLQFTPRGKNHGWDVFDTVRENPRYLVQHLSVKETKKTDGTPVITPEQIEEAKKMGMSKEMVEQEFMVSFEIGNLGAYFTREMSEMEREGRLTTLKANPSLPLHSAWDLGGTDATAGWLFQIEGNRVKLLHLLHDSGQPLKYYLDAAERIRQSIGCKWGNHFMPHDVKQEHQGWEHTESRLMQARKAGWNFQVTHKVNFEDGIEAIRYVFPNIMIDKVNCQMGVRAIREYQREYDDARACYRSKPLDNWATHIVDALRYLSINYRRLYDIPQGMIQYSVEGMG